VVGREKRYHCTGIGFKDSQDGESHRDACSPVTWLDNGTPALALVQLIAVKSLVRARNDNRDSVLLEQRLDAIASLTE